MVTLLNQNTNQRYRGLILGLCFCLTLLLCGCTPETSTSSSSTSSSSSTTNNDTAVNTTTPSTETSAATSNNESVTGLDGESVVANTPSEATPNPSPSGTSVGGSGGAALLSNLKTAGLSGEKLHKAWAIAMAESEGDPRAYNGNARTGDKSYGLFQINMIGAMGPERRGQLGISSNDEFFDPQVNIRAMMLISNNGTNWRPWSTYGKDR